MSNEKHKYLSTLSPNPDADTEADLKYRQVVAKFEEDQALIREMLDSLSMSLKQEDKEVLPIVQVLAKNSLRTEEMGVVFNLQSRLCKTITKKTDSNLADIHARISCLEEKGTWRAMFGKVKLVEELLRSAVYIGAALVAAYGFLY